VVRERELHGGVPGAQPQHSGGVPAPVRDDASVGVVWRRAAGAIAARARILPGAGLRADRERQRGHPRAVREPHHGGRAARRDAERQRGAARRGGRKRDGEAAVVAQAAPVVQLHVLGGCEHEHEHAQLMVGDLCLMSDSLSLFSSVHGLGF